MPSPASYLGEELPGLRCKATNNYGNKQEILYRMEIVE
jgi:hypothetical protein